MGTICIISIYKLINPISDTPIFPFTKEHAIRVCNLISEKDFKLGLHFKYRISGHWNSRRFFALEGGRGAVVKFLPLFLGILKGAREGQMSISRYFLWTEICALYYHILVGILIEISRACGGKEGYMTSLLHLGHAYGVSPKAIPLHLDGRFDQVYGEHFRLDD